MRCYKILQAMPKAERETYGAKRKAKYLLENKNIRMNFKKILRLQAKFGMKVRNRVKKHPKNYYLNRKENEKNLPVNILNREFCSSKPFEKLVTDISYFKVKGGWLFLSPVMDLYNNKILSYKISKSPDTELVLETMNDLFERYELKQTLIHSDQGSTYKAWAYRELLKEHNIIQSMSRKGNCWDNACIEHFFGTLKAESGYYEHEQRHMLSYNEMADLIHDFIEFYNNRRIQEKLNWKSPANYVA